MTINYGGGYPMMGGMNSMMNGMGTNMGGHERGGCLGEYLEVPRDARLPHAQQGDQLVDRKFVMEKHQGQPKPRFIRQCLEVAKCFHGFSE